jgi:hypothetical protein
MFLKDFEKIKYKCTFLSFGIFTTPPSQSHLCWLNKLEKK